MNNNKLQNLFPSTLRWLARIGSLASAAILMMFLFGGNEALPNLTEAMGLIFFPGGILLGMAIGWKKELIGGMVTLLSLIAFYVGHFLISGNLPGGPYFAIFASPGILFLASWWAAKFCDSGSGGAGIPKINGSESAAS